MNDPEPKKICKFIKEGKPCKFGNRCKFYPCNSQNKKPQKDNHRKQYNNFDSDIKFHDRNASKKEKEQVDNTLNYYDYDEVPERDEVPVRDELPLRGRGRRYNDVPKREYYQRGQQNYYDDEYYGSYHEENGYYDRNYNKQWEGRNDGYDFREEGYEEEKRPYNNHHVNQRQHRGQDYDGYGQRGRGRGRGGRDFESQKGGYENKRGNRGQEKRGGRGRDNFDNNRQNIGQDDHRGKKDQNLLDLNPESKNQEKDAPIVQQRGLRNFGPGYENENEQKPVKKAARNFGPGYDPEPAEEYKTETTTENPKAQNIQTYQKQSQKQRDKKHEITPKDDFRLLAVNPTITELSSSQAPALREIRMNKGFDDLNHYLDVNFRLLKEDFTSELREGLQSYQHDPTQSNTQVNIYPNAKISGFFATKAFFGLKLRIFMKRGVMSWQASRKLMYGGMLMFSDDKFKQRIAQCVIRDRDGWQMDDTLRKHGYIEIDVEILIDQASPQTDAFSTFQSMFGKPIIILESKCYYEAYYHILKQLQEIKTLPFQECIVDADPNAIQMPDYLTQVYELDYIIDKKVESFTLDHYQEKAFRTAFSTNISLIQGPPGTGKTYIGEKIAQTMLEILQKKNGKVYDNKQRKMVDCQEGLITGPILLTCYTNHALDQFLEKISEYTQLIVRLGGGTKNENLKKFGLREVQKSRGFKQNQAFFDLRREQESIANKCIQLTNYYEHAHQVGTIDVESVKSYKLSLQKLLTPRAIESVIYFLNHIESAYKDKEQRFLKSKPNGFKDFYNKTVQKQIQNPAIFEWLGILDLNFVFNKFQKEQKSGGNNNYDDNSNADADNAYLFEDQEIDNYAEIFEELRTASKQKAKITLLLQSQPLIFQDQGAKYRSYEELIQERRSNQQRFPSNKDAVLFLTSTASQNIHHVDMATKWRFNHLIVKACEQVLEDQIRVQSMKIQQNIPLLDKYEVELNQKILQASDVIAMTTTGAAKFKSLLSKVSSKIMIVEEAAQILEAHMTTSLTRDIEHMILIGDHEQLRPSLNVHRLSYLYNLDISMFERLINNKFENVMLRSQRRMRPEISEIVRQIYPGLQDDQKVKNFSNVRGVKGRNYLFFHHNHPEDQISGMMSKTNPKEADIIIRFVVYLIKQGYSPDQITVLSLYAGQLLCIKNKIAKSFSQQDAPIRRVRIQTVDNYQGEENDIIILSLVRSNHSDQIGFLKASNRVCVALSRARKGMFIFGNAECLRNASLKLDQKQEEAIRQKHIWLRVLEILEKRGDVREEMELICSHGKITTIRKASDFDKVPEGGCNEICGVQLKCGHYCESPCHWYECTPKNKTGHDHIICTKRCMRQRNCGHPCTYKCYECEFEDQPCMVEMSKTLECGHHNTYKCHEFGDGTNLKCQKPCEKTLPCGHRCQKLCKFDCEEISDADKKKGYVTSCKEKILKKLPCGHEVMVDCGQPPEMHLKHNGCSMMLKKQLNCGHFEMIRCDTEPQGCGQIVEKKLPCGHIKKMRCDKNLDDYLIENGCKIQCTGILECGCQCPKECGECFGNIFHGECLRKCNKINICGHECEGKCNQGCPPCKNPCRFYCAHKKCKLTCGQIFEPCMEPCTNNCDHYQCSKPCSEICDREPCQHPCKKKLQCGHDCIGICGEKCPPVCRVKDCPKYNEQTFQVWFGNEANPDAKFVMLEDCGHIIESEALDKQIKSKTVKGEIKYPHCPICKTTIRNCMRYQALIKSTTRKIDQIKLKKQAYTTSLFTSIVNEPFIDSLKSRIEAIVLKHQPPQSGDTPLPIYSQLVQSIFDQLTKICKDSQYIKDNGFLQAEEIQTYASKINCIDHIIQKIEEFEASGVDIEIMFQSMEGLEKLVNQLSFGQNGKLILNNKTMTWVTKFTNLAIHEDRILRIELIVQAFGLYMQILIGHELSKKSELDFPEVLVDINQQVWAERFNIDSDLLNNLKQLVGENIRSLGQYQAKEFQGIEMKELSLRAGLWLECPNGHLFPNQAQEGAGQSQCPQCDTQWTN